MALFSNPTQTSGNAPIPQSNALLFQTSTTSLATTGQTIVQNNIKNPNGLPMHNLYIDLNVTDTTGNTTAPVTPTSAETAFTQFTITGASGKQLLNINPSQSDRFRKLQHRLNNYGYYNTPPTPTDTATATTYSADYQVLLQNWVIYPEEFPLTFTIVTNTLASRATTVNLMTSTVQVTAYGDFVPLQRALPRTVIRIKPITGVTASTNFDFSTYLDSVPILDLSFDVGDLDSNIASGSGAINLLSNNNALIPNTAYQTVINRENQLYPISTPHIVGYFPINVLNGMKVINPATEKVTFQVNFSADAPNANGTEQEVDLIMVEAY